MNDRSMFIKSYNDRLSRYKKATEYFDNENIPSAEKERHEGAYKKLLRELSLLGQLLELEPKQMLEGVRE